MRKKYIQRNGKVEIPPNKLLLQTTNFNMNKAFKITEGFLSERKTLEKIKHQNHAEPPDSHIDTLVTDDQNTVDCT